MRKIKSGNRSNWDSLQIDQGRRDGVKREGYGRELLVYSMDRAGWAFQPASRGHLFIHPS